MWVFGQVWLLCLLAFVIGAGLDHLLFTRPLRKQVRQLEIQLAKAKRADAMPPPTPAETDAERTGIVDERPLSVSGWDPDRRPSWEREQPVESPRTLVAPMPEPDHGYGQPPAEPDHGYGQPGQDLGYAQPYEPEPAEPPTAFAPAPTPSYEAAQS